MQELWKAFRLWPIYWRLGAQDVRLRFRRSSLGAAWIFLHMGLSVATIGVVFGGLFGQPLRDFLPSLAAGLIVWTFLVSAVTEGGAAFLHAEGYIKQIGLPIYVYCLRTVVAVTLNLLLTLPVFVVVAAVSGLVPGPGLLWFLPGLALLVGFAAACSLLLSFLVVRFRELAQVIPAGMQLAFYATPVLYPPEFLADRGLGWIARLNPLHHLLQVAREPLVRSRPADLDSYLVALGLLAALLLLAALTAWRLRRRIVYFL